MNYGPKRAKYGVIEPVDAYFCPPKSFWLLGNPSPFMDQIYDEKQVLDLEGIPALDSIADSVFVKIGWVDKYWYQYQNKIPQ